jgi:hypothetical protein
MSESLALSSDLRFGFRLRIRWHIGAHNNKFANVSVSHKLGNLVVLEYGQIVEMSLTVISFSVHHEWHTTL